MSMGAPAPAPSPDQAGLVIITNTQMFNELRALTLAQDRTAQRIETLSTTLAATSTDVERRLRALEARRWPLPVVCAVLACMSCAASLWALTQGH